MTPWFDMPNLETIKFLTIEPPNHFATLIPMTTKAKELGDFMLVGLICDIQGDFEGVDGRIEEGVG